MKHLVPITILAAACLGAAAPGPQVAGLWKTPVDDSVVRIAPCGRALCGRVQTSARLRAAPGQKDERNKDAALRGRPIKGLLVLRLVPTGPGKWGDGFLYSPQDGGTYKGSLELTDDGRLRVTGCIIAPACSTQTWTRQ
jgi:uncharacterized protein (DUF2147 family)